MAEFTAFRNNALPFPVYSLPYVVAFPLLDADGDPVSPSSPDSEISKNGDTFADCTNEAVEIATSSGSCYLSLTGTELTTDCATVQIKSTGAKTTVLTLYPRKLVTIRTGTSASAGSSTSTIVLDASASAVDDFYNGMIVSAVIDSVTEVRMITDYTGSTQTCTVTPDWNTAPDNNDTFTVLRPDGVQVQQANVTHLNSTAQTARDIGASVLLSSGTGTGQLKLASGYVAMTWADIAAPTTSVALTGTTIATTQKVDVETIKTNPVVNAGTVTFPTTATLASTTNITAGTITTATNVTTVNGLAANVITAAATATDFGTEIGTAVWASVTRTLTSLSGLTLDTVTTLTNLPAITANWLTAAGTAADFTTEIQTGLATAANLATVAGYLDTEIAAILADTNELQTDWADGGRLDLILDARASQSSVDTIDGIVDAILVDTGTTLDGKADAIYNYATATHGALVVYSSTGNGGTGNDTTHINLTALDVPDGDVVGQVLLIEDVSESVTYTRHITAWDFDAYLATFAPALPFTPDAADNTVVLSVRRHLSLPDAAPGASGGLLISGANSGTTTLGALTVTGALLAGTNSVPWNAAWDAEVQSECADALAVYDPPTNAEMEARTLAAASYATASNLATVAAYLDTEIAAILEDTGTTLPAQIAALSFSTLDAAGVWAHAARTLTAATNITSTGGTTVPQTGDAFARIGAAGAGLTAVTISGTATTLDALYVALYAARADFGLTATGVRTAVGLASANLDTQLGDVPTNAELATALAAADDAVLAAIAALNNLSAAQVNAEVVDALATDTYAEPTGVPAATVSLAAKVGRLYKSLMRGIEVTATAKTFLDAAGADEWKKTLADDGTAYTEGSAASP